MLVGYAHKYVYSLLDYNLKATDMQAAVGCAQLKKFPSLVQKRRANFDRVYKALEGVQDKLILPVPAENTNPSWFGFYITCRDGVNRNQVVPYVESKGVQTRMLFAGNWLKHPCFEQMREAKEGYRVVGDLANTDRIMNSTFGVWVYPGMNKEMIDYMAKTIIETVK